ncbi:50S ribosomal protein L18 [Helicobacter canis]|uniref:Large ribosomal subunit protein uL18 n=1 Tax=Helicobacter canis TaxID=29419 RepID=A0A377J4Q1_9HELI|nr:50S ribosomal protein L18 [Helicobacter canis]STO97477.1 50S ribosomal protein L18 [Helicobacter canis]
MTDKVLALKKSLRLKRKARIRDRVSGVDSRPRISVFRSNKYLYAQAIDDVKQVTIATVDGRKLKLGNNKEQVKEIAVVFAQELKSKGINEAVFDRNGYLFHGVIRAFADSLREQGITL